MLHYLHTKGSPIRRYEPPSSCTIVQSTTLKDGPRYRSAERVGSERGDLEYSEVPAISIKILARDNPGF
jgi:hypothetical protein